MIATTLAWVAALFLAAPETSVEAYPPWWQPGQSRIVVGLNGGGVMANLSASTARARDQAGGRASTLGLAIEYERRVFRYVSIAAVGSYSQWDGAAAQTGYRDERFDLGVSPHLEVLRTGHPGAWLGELYLGLPVGVTMPFVTAPEHRAFTERIDDSVGWYAGGAIGLTVLFRHWGARFEGCYCRHDHRRRSAITLDDPTQASIREDTHLIDDQLLFTFAGVFAF